MYLLKIAFPYWSNVCFGCDWHISTPQPESDKPPFGRHIQHAELHADSRHYDWGHNHYRYMRIRRRIQMYSANPRAEQLKRYTLFDILENGSYK